MVLKSSSLPKETDASRANARSGAELTGGAASGSLQPPGERAPEDVATASSRSASAPLVGDEAVAEKQAAGLSPSLGERKPRLRQAADGSTAEIQARN